VGFAKGASGLDSLKDHLKVKSLQQHQYEVNEIRRNARHWRLMDCDVETLEAMRHAVIHEIENIEVELNVEDQHFRIFIENAQPLKAEALRDVIERLSLQWDELNEHLKEIDDVILERHLHSRLIKLFRSKMLYFAFEGVVFLSILVVIILVIIEFTVSLPDQTRRLFLRIDTGISLFLLADFFLRLGMAEDRRWYIRRFWIDFVASLPLAFLHFGRLFRITRYVQLLRLLRFSTAMRVVAFAFREIDKLFRTFQLNLLKRSLAIAVVLLLFGAFMISVIEAPNHADFMMWRESFWWSFTTVVTGGFADIYNPETTSGRVLTVVLVLVGFGVTGVFTASLTSVLIEDDSTRLEHNQIALEREIGVIHQKLDLLSGETNRGLIALEVIAQSLSNQSSIRDLSYILVQSVLEHFAGMHASVHLWDGETAVLTTAYQHGDERVQHPEQMTLDDSLLGKTVKALSELENPAHMDIEPITESVFELDSVRMICPLVAGNELIGALQVILPEEHGRFYLYNRVPQTMAHHAAVSLYLLKKMA
jgi:voltage-gated potassium channel